MAEHPAGVMDILSEAMVYIGEHTPETTKVILHIYDKDAYQRYHGYDRQLIDQALAENQQVWVDIYGLADSNNISQWCREFNIHPLVVEDILHTRQRPKVDFMQDGLFVVCRLLSASDDLLTYNSEQLSMVVKKNMLFTFRESNEHDLTYLYNRLSTHCSLIREEGCDYLLYLLMDSIVDDYFAFVEEMEKKLSALEDVLINDPNGISLHELYTLKRRIMVLRKTISPLRDIVHLLISEYGRHIDPKYHLYYRDLYDHSIRLVESIDLQREMAKSMLDIYHSSLNNRMNETMKLLTLFTTIFIPLTFITGLYGMNFENMPGLKGRYSYLIVVGIMFFLAVGMISYFKRKKIL